MPGPGMMPAGGGGGPRAQPIQIAPADYQAFEQLLQASQAAWTAHDLNGLRAMVTPEMLSYFAEQLAEQTSRGVRNEVTDVRLLQGDLAQAWTEGGREYATVAMRFSMIDVTRDRPGGSSTAARPNMSPRRSCGLSCARMAAGTGSCRRSSRRDRNLSRFAERSRCAHRGCG